MSIVIRSYNVLRGLLGSVVLWFERRNPEALLENEKENLQSLLAKFNTGLVDHATVSARLDSQIAHNSKQAETLGYRINALLGAGDRAGATREALALKDLTARIEQEKAQRNENEATFKTLVARRDASVSEARNRIERLRWQMGDLKVKRAIADLEGMAQSLISSFDGGGASLARLEDMVSHELDRAGARARVAQAQQPPALAVNDAVQEAMAADALAEFLQSSPRRIEDLRAPAEVDAPMTPLPLPSKE